MVSLSKLRENMCFTVDGRADDVLRLLEDPDRGMCTRLEVRAPVQPVEVFFHLLKASLWMAT